MTKADLIDNLYEKVGISKKESAMIVEQIFEIIRIALEKGKKLRFLVLEILISALKS